MNTPFTINPAGIACFSGLAGSPIDFVHVNHDGRPPIASADQAVLVHGAGRTGYGFARMAARAPGNEDSLVMMLPQDIQEWHRLSTTNGNARYLADGIVINPLGEKQIHFLPPRDVTRKLAEVERRVENNRELEPVVQWAREQLRDDRVASLAEYWLAAVQTQVVTTRVRDIPAAVDRSFIGRLHPGVKYTLLHPSKSMAAPRQPGGIPLFGHELLQALLTEGGRSDLVGWVVASGGYWVDSTVWAKERIRICFASSDSQESVEAAKRAIGGDAGSYDLVDISSEVGSAAVFAVQFGGWIKNFIANILGFGSASIVASLPIITLLKGEIDYARLARGHDKTRERLIKSAQKLATRAMRKEGLIAHNEEIMFPSEVVEDIMACTTINWPALVSEAKRMGLFDLIDRVGNPLSDNEKDFISKGMVNFVNTAQEGLFGTTNNTVAIVYGLAVVLTKVGLISSPNDVFDRRLIPLPEGILAMPYVTVRFGSAGVSKEFTRAIEEFQPLLA